MFTSFTNKWKTREEEAKNMVLPVPSVSFTDLKKATANLEFHPVRVGLQGEQYKPRLPLPPEDSITARISYWKEKVDIQKLAEELLPNVEELSDKEIRRGVGEASFDYAYKNLIKK